MPKAIDLTPKKAATFGRLIEAVSTSSVDGTQADADPLRQIGNAAFRGLLARMEQGEWLMPATNGNGTTGSLKEVVETVDKLDELRTRGEDRLARRLKEAEERAEKAERALAQAQDNQVSGLGAIVQAFTTALTAMQQQTLTIIQNQYQQTLQLINELRQSQAPRDSGDGWLAQIGREAIQQALNRDPLADYERISSALDKAMEKHLAHQRTGATDPQTLAAYLSYDLEKFKAQLQYELQREGVQRSKEISEQIAEYLGRAAREKEEQEADEEEARPRTVPRSNGQPRRAPEVYTYRCGACGEDFTLRRYAAEVTCPHCGTRLVARDGRADTVAERMTRLAQPTAAAPAGEVAEAPADGRAGGPGSA